LGGADGGGQTRGLVNGEEEPPKKPSAT
jgi:hypothetical protein